MASTTPPAFLWKAIARGRKGPGPRSRHCLAYNRSAHATILVGGVLGGRDGGLQKDTWELFDGEWSPIDTRKHALGRHRAAMVYDERRGKCVLFGGEGGEGDKFSAHGDTWTYAKERWERRLTGSEPGPRPRCGHAMAYDEEAEVVVLFGGTTGNPLKPQPLGDTWLFDGAAWHPVPGPAPPARRYAAFAYDPGLKGCVLHGGSEDDAGTRGFGDTWLFRDGIWSRLPKAFDTGARDDHGLAYHWAAKRLVMFGGHGSEHQVLTREANGWREIEGLQLPPRHQCSPLCWDEDLEGLVCHGGELHSGGPQFDTTWVLKLSSSPKRRDMVGGWDEAEAYPEVEAADAAPPAAADRADRIASKGPYTGGPITCHRCGVSFQPGEGCGGEFASCPKCGSYTSLPGSQPAPTLDCAEPFKSCPHCGKELPAKAMLCVRCGYNYKAGQVVKAPQLQAILAPLGRQYPAAAGDRRHPVVAVRAGAHLGGSRGCRGRRVPMADCAAPVGGHVPHPEPSARPTGQVLPKHKALGLLRAVDELYAPAGSGPYAARARHGGRRPGGLDPATPR